MMAFDSGLSGLTMWGYFGEVAFVSKEALDILLEDRCGYLTKLSAFSGLHWLFSFHLFNMCSSYVQHAFSFWMSPPSVINLRHPPI